MIGNHYVTIARGLNYDLSIDKTLNCAYLELKGYWNSPVQMEDYLSDVERAVNKLSDGFMFLVDMTNFSGCTPENIKLNIQAQKLLVKAGLTRTAEVIPDNPVLRSVAESMSEESKMNTVYFKDRVTAEKWIELSAETGSK